MLKKNKDDALQCIFTPRKIDDDFTSQMDKPFLLLGANKTNIPADDWERNDYPFLVIEYVLQGKGRVVVDGKSFKVKAGDIYFLPKRSSHLLESKPGPDFWIKKYAVFSGRLADSMIKSYGLDGELFFPDSGSPELEKLLDELTYLHLNIRPERNDAGALVFLKIVQHLSSCNSKTTKFNRNVKQIIYYLESNLYSKLNLKKMCLELGMSQSKLLLICHREIGVTPYEYLLRRKIERAKQYLEGNEMISISEIAENLSFTDAYHFSRTFHKRTGQSPSKYRQSFGKKI